MLYMHFQNDLVSMTTTDRPFFSEL